MPCTRRRAGVERPVHRGLARVVFPIGRTRLDVRSARHTCVTTRSTAIRFAMHTPTGAAQTATVRHSLVVSVHAS